MGRTEGQPLEVGGGGGSALDLGLQVPEAVATRCQGGRGKRASGVRGSSALEQVKWLGNRWDRADIFDKG